LTASSALSAGDLGAFGNELRRALPSQSMWRMVFLSDPTGRQLLNAATQAGSLSPSDADPRSFEKAAASGEPTFGSVARWPATDAHGMAVRLPVQADGRIAYVLTAVVDPDQVQRLIAAQNLPDGWRSGLVHASGRFIARIPRRSPDETAAPNFRAATQRNAEGWYRGRRLEGDDTFTAHVTSPATGWSLVRNQDPPSRRMPFSVVFNLGAGCQVRARIT
jgi:hypothetical protein